MRQPDTSGLLWKPRQNLIGISIADLIRTRQPVEDAAAARDSLKKAQLFDPVPERFHRKEKNHTHCNEGNMSIKASNAEADEQNTEEKGTITNIDPADQISQTHIATGSGVFWSSMARTIALAIAENPSILAVDFERSGLANMMLSRPSVTVATHPACHRVTG